MTEQKMRKWQELYVNKEGREIIEPTGRIGAIGDSRLPWHYLDKRKEPITEKTA